MLSQGEAVGFAALLLFAGAETTTNLIGNAVRALLDTPTSCAEPSRTRLAPLGGRHRGDPPLGGTG